MRKLIKQIRRQTQRVLFKYIISLTEKLSLET